VSCDCPQHGAGDQLRIACRNERLRVSALHPCSCQCHASTLDRPRVPVEHGIDIEGYIEGIALPCPFCGSDRIYISHDHGEYNVPRSHGGERVDPTLAPRPTWAACCAGCAASGPWRKSSAAAALTEWNRRS